MTIRTTTTLALAIGILIGLGLAQALPSASASATLTQVMTTHDAVIVMVNGQERARFDAAGLHVNGDLAYSGASIDTVTYAPAASPKAGAP